MFLACCRHFAAGETRSSLQTGNPPPIVSFPAKNIRRQLWLTAPFRLWDYFLCSSSNKNVIVPIKGFPLIPPPLPPNTPIRALGMSSWQFSIHPFVVVCELYIGRCFICPPDESTFPSQVSGWWTDPLISSFRPSVRPLFFSTIFWGRLLICSRWRRTWHTETDRESSEDHRWQPRSNFLVQLQSFYISALFATHLPSVIVD